jgi:hypothetical protein
MIHIATLVEVHETLLSLGYQSAFQNSSVAVKVGGLDKPFVAVITHNQSTNHFQITCLVTKLGQIDEDNLTHFAIAALDANSRIVPFAFALLTEATSTKANKVEDWPVVLVHAIPVGDLSRGELDSAMKSLVAALIASANVLELLKQPAKK